MVQSVEDIIEEAKEKRKKAEAIEALETLDTEGLLPKSPSETERPSAFASSAVHIVDAQHHAKDENVQQTHSNIKDSLLAPIIELSIIQEATKKENALFAQNKTLDQLTALENDIVEKELTEMHTDVLQLLVSLNARGREDANKNLDSMVAGEQARISAEMGGLPGSQAGFFRRLYNKAVGK